MSKEGYLQTKIQDLNEKIKTLEEKEKYLSIKYDKVESLLNNEVSTVLEDIEHIKKTEEEIKYLPKKAFEYVRDNLNSILQIELNKIWNEQLKVLKDLFLNQSKVNAFEFNQMAKKYMKNPIDFEIKLGTIMNILIHKNIMTNEEFEACKLEYKKAIMPLVKKDLFTNKAITGDLKTVDKILSSDFSGEDLIRENKKILEE